MKIPEPVKTDSRICFGISYFQVEKCAEEYAAHVRKQGRTYNGGFRHGEYCGREPERDYTDAKLGRLYAVTD